MLQPRLSFVSLLLFFSLTFASKTLKNTTSQIKENGSKKSYASHVMSNGAVAPLHGENEDFTPDFNFHYKTHDIPNEDELSTMITGKKPKLPGGVSLLNVATEAADKALNGKVLSNDVADKLGLNSPNYLSKIGLKNMSITGSSAFKKSLTSTSKIYESKPLKHEKNTITKRFELPYAGEGREPMGTSNYFNTNQNNINQQFDGGPLQSDVNVELTQKQLASSGLSDETASIQALINENTVPNNKIEPSRASSTSLDAANGLTRSQLSMPGASGESVSMQPQINENAAPQGSKIQQSLDTYNGLTQSQLSLLGSPDEQSASMQSPVLPDSPTFNLNENSADKIMKQVDSYTESNPDTADNVLQHLSSFNAAQVPDDSKIMKNLPSEIRSELQPEEQLLADDDQSAKKNFVKQRQQNDHLESQFSSNNAVKEFEAASKTLIRQADSDGMSQRSLNNDGVPRNEKEAEMQGITRFTTQSRHMTSF